jgi:hypothetical protein
MWPDARPAYVQQQHLAFKESARAARLQDGARTFAALSHGTDEAAFLQAVLHFSHGTGHLRAAMQALRGWTSHVAFLPLLWSVAQIFSVHVWASLERDSVRCVKLTAAASGASPDALHAGSHPAPCVALPSLTAVSAWDVHDEEALWYGKVCDACTTFT